MRFRGGRNSAGGASSAGPWIPVHAQGQRRNQSSKNQAPNTRKVPNHKLQGGDVAGRIGIWSLGFFWSLVFGVWCFADSSLRMNGMVSKLNPSLKVDPPKTKTPSDFLG